MAATDHPPRAGKASPSAETSFRMEMLPQPDDTTCGPTCLHAVYRFFGDEMPLERVIGEAPQLKEGGTLAALLGRHALERGYRADLYTFDIQTLDPTWFEGPAEDLADRLREQMTLKPDPKLHVVSRAYMDFLAAGGRLLFQDLTTSLTRRLLKRGLPVITGLSATFLYRTARERDVDGHMVFDDMRGEPSGHFVVLRGYDKDRRAALVSDPLLPNPLGKGHDYEVSLTRLVCSIMLGALTFDANLLVISPRGKARARRE